MARQSPVSRSINENAFEDEVDLMELFRDGRSNGSYFYL